MGALMQAFLLVGAGGALGAMARYGFGVLVHRVWPVSFPVATLGVNIIGSLLMGLFVGALVRYTPAWQADMRLFAAIGLLGGFTTFSSFSLDVIVLLERGQVLTALGYILISVIAAILALYLGMIVMRGTA